MEIENKMAQPVDAKAEVKISPDKLEATLKLSPPENGGSALTLEQLEAVLKEHGVIFGISHARLDSMADKPEYGRSVSVAQGIAPVDGKDATIKYYVNLDKNLRPKEHEDGSVDFKDLGIIEQVEKDALLCEKTPPTQGSSGTDVLGNKILAKPGKDMPMQVGRNTVLSEDRLRLTAGMSGQVELSDNRINVFDSFTVKGDVSPATGNISFSGNVVITGGVLSGFSVEADGNIDINGIVEAAFVKAGGSLVIRGGFSGGERGELIAGSDAFCRFIQAGVVNVGGDLDTTYILNSEITCGGSIVLTGKGLIMGGNITARGSVSANYLGSASSTAATTISVGIAPALVKRSRELPLEITECEKNIKNVEKLAKTMLKLKRAGALPPDKAENLKKLLAYRGQLIASLEMLEYELETVTNQVDELGNSMVKVYKKAYPGVKIVITQDGFPLKSEYSYTSFRRTREGIACSPML